MVRVELPVDAVHDLHLQAELSDDGLDSRLPRQSQPLGQLGFAALDVVLDTGIVN